MQMSELRKSVSTNSNSVVQIEDKVAQVKRAMEEMEERERERDVIEMGWKEEHVRERTEWQVRTTASIESQCVQMWEMGMAKIEKGMAKMEVGNSSRMERLEDSINNISKLYQGGLMQLHNSQLT